MTTPHQPWPFVAGAVYKRSGDTHPGLCKFDEPSSYVNKFKVGELYQHIATKDVWKCIGVNGQSAWLHNIADAQGYRITTPAIAQHYSLCKEPVKIFLSVWKAKKDTTIYQLATQDKNHHDKNVEAIRASINLVLLYENFLTIDNPNNDFATG